MMKFEDFAKMTPDEITTFVSGLPENFGIKGVSGVTVDGRIVVRHVAKYVSTHGIPLDVVLAFWHERGYAVDWLNFVQESMAEGASLRTVRAKILEAIGVVYTPKQQDEFKEKLELLWLIV